MPPIDPATQAPTPVRARSPLFMMLAIVLFSVGLFLITPIGDALGLGHGWQRVVLRIPLLTPGAAAFIHAQPGGPNLRLFGRRIGRGPTAVVLGLVSATLLVVGARLITMMAS